MLTLYFDSSKEYVFLDDGLTEYPLGKAFIDLISVDFLYRNFENSLVIEENPLLTLFNTLDDIRNLSEDNIKILADYLLATDYVLNIDNKELGDTDIYTRYHIYQKYIRPAIADNKVSASYLWKPNNSDKYPAIENKTLKDIATSLNNYKIDLIETYTVTSIEEGLYISFMKMVENKVTVKKCKCCGNYFIPQGRIDTEYCDRYAPDSTKTCREIGATKKYHERSKNNPILQEFQKRYKKMNSRVRIKKLSQSDFFTWSEKARSLRDMAIDENMSLDKFITELSKLEG